jgi:peptide/nickel transport system substrate-binding protein
MDPVFRARRSAAVHRCPRPPGAPPGGRPRADHSSAHGGAAGHGNDLFGAYDPILDTGLVRNQDIEQAKSLLKQAGHESLTTTLTYANIFPGSVEQCQVLAATVKPAGINIRLREVDAGTLYGNNYTNWPFSIDAWPGLNYLVLISSDDGPNSHPDESHFHNARFNSLYTQAIGTLDVAKRTEIAHEMQMIEFNEGGNIITCFPNYTAAYSPKVGGFYPANLTGNAVAAGYYNLLGFVA